MVAMETSSHVYSDMRYKIAAKKNFGKSRQVW